MSICDRYRGCSNTRKNNREARWCEMVHSDSSFICDFGHRGIYWRRNCYYGKRGNQYGNNNWKALHY